MASLQLLPFTAEGDAALSFLLYCILRSQKHNEPLSLTGVNARPVLFVTADGLSAAVSPIAPRDLIPDESRVLAYEKVIAVLHHGFTVIPMRYGCVLDEESKLILFLKEQRDRYMALLKELDGHVEMGIRILPSPEQRQLQIEATPAPRATRQNRHSRDSGRDYLAAQRLYYSRRERDAGAETALIERVRITFTGLFTKSIVEGHGARTGRSAPPAPLISLYFLVPAKSVEEFRGRFHSLDPGDSVKLLLSGPWAPYNFVVSEKCE